MTFWKATCKEIFRFTNELQDHIKIINKFQLEIVYMLPDESASPFVFHIKIVHQKLSYNIELLIIVKFYSAFIFRHKKELE